MSSSTLFGDLLIGAACDIGKKRKSNQDSLIVLLPADGVDLPPLFVIADGMGGHNGGETASRLIIETFREVYAQLQPTFNIGEAFTLCVKKAHQVIREQASQDEKLKGMGSTVVAAFLLNDSAYTLNVGDSRAYLLRGEQVIQISVDQSWVMDQVRAGRLTLEQARRHRKRNHLSMSLSANRPTIVPIVKEEIFQPNDILLLCSDGLWGIIPESLLWAAANEFEPQEAADKLIALANQSGGADNISIIIARRQDRQPVKTMQDDVTGAGE
ncbi:MAG: hypothetical protein B6D38_03650 [Anaerolineae bacterium UTCFX1]|jgi:serine/threonine protein phosphatase PrpC|nr:MAG: hypothetical protein B6D38_03650 [Anaerolineae bacterium UTCFX1]